ALDREVILEAPKSLQFRLMYWQGTMKILRNQPVIGCGPGNFRQAYLVQKALEASEEIRDPHNAILEAWTSGGLLSLLGMILVIAAVFRADGDSGNSSSSVKLSDAAAENRRLKVKRPQDSTGISLWILLGFGIHVVWQWLSGSDPLFEEPSRAIILAGALLTSWLLPIPSQLHGTNVWQAALIGLLLHLMGAGGFQMPAVMLLAFAALSGISTSGNNSDFTASLTRTPMKGSAESSPGLTPQSKDVAWISAGHRIALTFCLMTGFVVALFGLRPVWISQSLAASAQFAASQSNNRTAVDLLERSSLADPLSVSAPRQLAEYQSQRLSQMLTRIGRQVDPIASAIAVNDSSDLSAADHASSAASETEGLPDEVLKQSKAAREACELYIRADVTNVGAMRLRAELLRQLFTASRDVKILEDAISDQNKVVRMNPSSAEDWWQLTLLLSLSRESSAQDALRKSLQRTIELDDINHAWGHRDRYLTEAKREFLRKLSVD
ncbi:MAG: O-antigen ligase family protein, partial [Planctomyces sp.]